MRVIAGEYRSRTLVAPRGMATRPTTDRLRETLFNVLAPRLAGAAFLDLYAGSGANGIEALSRGAARALFVEQAPAAVAALRTNLESLGISQGFAIEVRAVAAWLRRQSVGQTAGFDVVFLDPPYEHAAEYASTLTALGGPATEVLLPGGVVVAEHRRAKRGGAETGPGERYGSLVRTRVLEQGDAALSFYSHKPGSEAPGSSQAS